METDIKLDLFRRVVLSFNQLRNGIQKFKENELADAIIFSLIYKTIPTIDFKKVSDDVFLSKVYKNLFSESNFEKNIKLVTSSEIPFQAKYYFGTHTVKIPDSRNSIIFHDAEFKKDVPSGCVFKISTNEDVPGLDSYNLKKKTGFNVAGNASLAKWMSLFILHFDVDNKYIPFHEAFKRNKVKLINMLGEVFVNKLNLVLSYIEQSYESGNIPNNIPNYTTQIFSFNLLNEKYDILSPLTSVEILTELHKRIRERYNSEEKGIYVNVKHFYVGGTKSINAGLLSNDLGGRMSRFASVPPSMNLKNNKNSVVWKIENDIPLSYGKVKHDTMEYWRNNWNNESNIQKINYKIKSIENIVEDLISPSADLGIVDCDISEKYLKNNEFFLQLFNVIDIKKDANYFDICSKKIKQQILNILSGNKYNSINGKKVPVKISFVPSDDDGAFIQKVIRNFLMNI